jgi:PAS domain S-box-containing protein
VKPFSARELLARVRANIDMARLRREAQKALQDLRQQLQSIFEDAPFGIYLVDSDLRVRQVNPIARAVFGSISDVVGRDFDEVMHVLWPKDYADEVVRLFRRTLETGDPYFVPERAEKRLDRAVSEYYEWRIRRIPLPEGRYGVVCYFQDISVQVLARQVIAASGERLRELNQALERQVEERTQALEAEMLEHGKAEMALQAAQRLEAIGRLTGGVAHDFNNLLTVVAGQAELMLKAAGQNEAVHRSVAAIQRAADRGAKLTAQLLAFSRRQNLRPSVVAIDRLIASFDVLFRRAAGETIQVDFRAAPDLWPALVDPAQFESALLNLVINARDAMPDGGRITIQARNKEVSREEAARLDIATGSYVVASVADTGIGMSPDVREHAFEPFFTTKDIGKGTGLGLAQIYGFAKQSGGAVSIDSTLGKGTIVSLYLPKSDGRVADEPAAVPITANIRHGETVLIVEDQPEVREIVEELLADLGYRVLTASDSAAARNILRGDGPIALMLTDMVMPGGTNGRDLIEEARRLRQDMKFILMSGYARDFQGDVGTSQKFAFIEKPFKPAELAALIDQVLDS